MTIHISQPQAYSEIGQKPNQEDTLFPKIGSAIPDMRVFIVCDGMGGHEHGEVASKCVAETIGKNTPLLSSCTVKEMQYSFERALSMAYANLDALDTGDTVRTMGTTLTFLALCTDGVLVAHIGDSRVYQFRPGEGIVFQTRDHSLVNDLISSGEITEEEARNHPQRNVITRAVQPHQEYPARPTYNILTDIRKGDIFMLCCDGVIEQLDNNDLTAIITADRSLESKIEKLKNECAQRNTRDNNSCYLIEVSEISDNASVTTPIPHPSWHISTKTITTMIVVALICFLLGFFAFHNKTSRSAHPAKHENVQGPISRSH